MDLTIDAAVARHAETQHGIFTRTQARCLGATDRVIQHRLDTGRWAWLHFTWKMEYVVASIRAGLRIGRQD
ncbi:MAG: hypothetical protein ABW008_04915 [Acidimicrobiales bacterium]